MNEYFDNTFDQLTPEQTEVLLTPPPATPVDALTKRRIRKNVMNRLHTEEGSAVPAPARRPMFARKLIACAAATLAIVVGTVSLVSAGDSLVESIVEGTQNVVAVVRRAFAFIPGVGITEVPVTDGEAGEPGAPTNISFLTYKSDVESIPASDDSGLKARMVRTHYADGKLEIIVEVDGRELWDDDAVLYIGENEYRTGDEGIHITTSNHASSGTIDYGDGPVTHTHNYTRIHLSLAMDEPTPGDIVEVGVKGFDGRLSAAAVLLTTFEELEEIGQTVEKNGISLTITTEWVDDKLIVWTTPYILENAPQDKFLAYGFDHNNDRYSQRWNERQKWQWCAERDLVESNVPPRSDSNRSSFYQKLVDDLTEELGMMRQNTHILANEPYVVESRYLWQYTPGMGSNSYMGYDRYDIPEHITEGTLKIPFLLMQREESHSQEIALPTEYTEEALDVVFETSLGKVRLISVSREKQDAQYDRIFFDVIFEDADPKYQIDDIAWHGEYDGRKFRYGGRNNDGYRISCDVANDEDTMVFFIDSINYCLMDEYSFELDLTRPAVESTKAD